MQTSLFLAKLIGPVLIVMGLAVIIDPERFRKLAHEFIESEALIYLSGIIVLPVGLAIVNTHNVWVMDWPVIMTLFGWIAVAAGIARIVMPGPLKGIGRAMIERTSYFVVAGALWALLGAYVFYQGYIA